MSLNSQQKCLLFPGEDLKSLLSQLKSFKLDYLIKIKLFFFLLQAFENFTVYLTDLDQFSANFPEVIFVSLTADFVSVCRQTGLSAVSEWTVY